MISRSKDSAYDNTPHAAASTPLRVGGIDYLNAQPLLHGLEREDTLPLRVTHHCPGDLATMLKAGDLDVALLPVVACAERPDYHVIPQVGISSYGHVRSIRLYHRCPLAEARSVCLDASSRTSVLLTRLLYRDLWGGAPSFSPVDPGELREALQRGAPGGADFDAALLIGDAALESGGVSGWEHVDLGTEWTRWTGLPFVYAVWVCRAPHGPAGLPTNLVGCFQAARDRGVARVDDIVKQGPLPEGMDAGAGRHYLSRLIQYDLDRPQLEGLHLFLDRLRAGGLITLPEPAIRFLPDAVESSA